MMGKEENICKCACKLNSMDNDTINKLERRVKFLEDEIAQKNYQLNFLMEFSSVKENIEDNLFKFPKRTFKCSNKNNHKTEIKLANRFENLNFDESNEDDEDDVIIIADSKEKKQASKNRKQTELQKRKESATRGKRKKFVSIIGDSIIKDVKGYELSKDENLVVVKSFRGATTKAMYHYMIPTVEKHPDVLIIHTGTNDLKEEKDPKEVARKVIDLAKKAQTYDPGMKVNVSLLTPRKDGFSKQVIEVNRHLKDLCNENQIAFIDHSNVTTNHLNRSKLHLRENGSKLISKNFESFIYN